MAGRKKKDIREMLFWKRLHYTLVKLDYRFRYLNNPEKYIKAEYKKVAHDNLELNLKSPQRLTETIEELGSSREMYPNAPESGIYILPEDTPVGADAVEVLGLHDVVFD